MESRITARALNRAGIDAEHDLSAAMPAVRKHLMGDASVLQRQHGADVRFQFPAIEQRGELVQPRRSHIHIKVSGSNAITLLHCLGHGRDAGDQNPAGLQNSKRPLRRISSNRIENDVHSGQRLLESRRLIVNDSFGAQPPDVVDAIGGDGRDHMEAGLAGQLYRVGAHVACGPMNERRLPGGVAGHAAA